VLKAKKKTYLTIIGFVLIQSLVYSQNNNESKKDSIMNFLFRGLWIEYEQQKHWSSEKDTIINFTSDEYEKYYSAKSTELDSLGTIFIMEDNYARRTAAFLEKRTKLKRKQIHKAQNLIPILDKEIIKKWNSWYLYNKMNVNLSELTELLKYLPQPRQ